VLAQNRPVRIGMLGPFPLAKSLYAPGVVRRLEELGYRESNGAILEYRSSDGHADRYTKLARELIELKCDVIFAIGTEPAARAVQTAGSSIPLVFLAADYDPVERGIVTSLRKPDRNSTGLYLQQYSLIAKRIEILREALPAARRLILFTDVFSRDQLPSARTAAAAARFDLAVVEFTEQPYDFAGAVAGHKAQALMVLSSPMFSSNAALIAGLLAKHRLPSIGSSVRHAEGGFLFSLGVDPSKVGRRVADLGARILKGSKPADIPVELADEFDLIINAKTARALGVKVPESVLARATRIVE
jgi:putative ABC transport system substrate-binding protein